MGAVYLAHDQRLDSPVALKETRFTDQRMSKAFEREARLLARLRHPALPRVSDHFIEENGQFLIMEYIPGEDLAETLKRRAAPFSYEDVTRWADQLLDALEYLHSQEPPIVHRDIKPQNLKLTERGQIILLDFGLAKGMPLHMTRVTSSGSIYGYTPSYAPMEQIQGAGTDPRSDLYSLGATLYHFLTGATPMDALTRAAAVLEGQPDPLRAAIEENSQGASAVAAVIQKALALSRNHRHASATEMRRAIRTALESANETRDEQTAVIGSPKEVVIPLRQESEQPSAPAAAQGEPEQAKHDSDEKETLTRGDSAVKVKDLVSAGSSAFDAGRYEMALEHWVQALKLSPGEPGIKEGIDAAERVIRKEAGRKVRVQRLIREGTEAFDAKSYHLAVEKWTEALSLSPNEPGVAASVKTARAAEAKEKERQGNEVAWESPREQRQSVKENPDVGRPDDMPLQSSVAAQKEKRSKLLWRGFWALVLIAAATVISVVRSKYRIEIALYFLLAVIGLAVFRALRRP